MSDAAVMEEDQATKSLRKLDETGAWEIVRAVPIFRGHQIRDKKGTLHTVTEANLQEIAEKTNALEADSGVIPKLRIGHVRPDVMETDQAPVVGYARNLRVGTFGPSKIPAILCDLYYRRSDYEQAIRYPQPSVEYYPDTQEIRGVALLSRDPQLDLGMIICQRMSDDGNWIHYQLKDATMADEPKKDDDKKDDKGPPGTAVAPEAALGEPGDDEPLTYGMLKTLPGYKYACQMMQSTAGAAPAMPAMQPPGAGLLPPPAGAPPMQTMQKTDEALKYEKLEADNAAMKAALTRQQGALESLEKQSRLLKYEKELTELRDQQNIVLNVEQEMKYCADMMPEQFARHVTLVLPNYPRGPGGGIIQLGNDDAGRSVPNLPYKPPSEDQTDRALAYMRKKGCDWEEAIQYVRTGKAG